MAENLIIYYSLEGNVDFLASALAKELDADLCRLETVKDYPKTGLLKFFHAGKDASVGFKPELRTAIPDFTSYSCILIGSPVWAAKPAAPINTLLDKADFSGKKVAVFASSGGGSTSKCIGMISEKVSKKGGTVIARESFTNPLKKQKPALESVKNFVKKILQ